MAPDRDTQRHFARKQASKVHTARAGGLEEVEIVQGEPGRAEHYHQHKQRGLQTADPCLEPPKPVR